LFSTTVVASVEAWTVGTVEAEAEVEPGRLVVGAFVGTGVDGGAADCGPDGAGALWVALGEAVWGFVLARKYCRPKKTVTRTSIMTRSDLLSPPPC
jgi:hypothetical protein